MAFTAPEWLVVLPGSETGTHRAVPATTDLAHREGAIFIRAARGTHLASAPLGNDRLGLATQKFYLKFVVAVGLLHFFVSYSFFKN